MILRKFIPVISFNGKKIINHSFKAVFSAIFLRRPFRIDNPLADYLAIFWYSWISAKLIPDITEQ